MGIHERQSVIEALLHASHGAVHFAHVADVRKYPELQDRHSLLLGPRQSLQLSKHYEQPSVLRK